MRSTHYYILGLLAALQLTCSLANPLLNSITIRVKTQEDFAAAQAIVSNKITRPVETQMIIYVSAGDYILYDTFRIDQSNVSIIAEPGTRAILAPNINKPVVAIGSQEEYPTYVIENIYISGVEIDGNKNNQTSENEPGRFWIRNNGIDVRSVQRLRLDNVVSNNTKSGGLVVSWGSSDVYVSNSSFNNNHYDGVAYYDSKRIYTSNSSMRDNGYAGVSIDNDLRDSIFSNCIIDSNHQVGIFARFSQMVTFNDCRITNSGDYAVFLGHNEDDNGVLDYMFSTLQILNNKGGVFMSSPGDQSKYNSIVGCVFRGNNQSGRQSIYSIGSKLWLVGNIVMD